MKKKAFIMGIILTVIPLAFLFLYLNYKNPPNNIIIILVDALRKDHLGCYGYQRNTSPNIDKFATEATKFEETISTCSWTSPSIASLFTSLYVSSHGVMTHSQKNTDLLDHKFETLAEVLKKEGYTTAAFIANRWIREEFNYHQGFDLFEQVGGNIPRPSGALVKEKVTQWLKCEKKEPFFLYVHFMDVHGPYVPPYPYNTLFTSKKMRELTVSEYKKLRYLEVKGQMNLNFYINQYDGGIRYCDYHIGKIIQYLKDKSLFDSTIIIITSDHGEAFFEHGECDHGFTLYNEEIMVPLVIKFPSSIEPVINESITPQLIDIGVTILEIIGARFPYKVDGFSLVSSDKQKRNKIYSEEYMKGFPKVAMIEGYTKYIYHIPKGKIVEVYNLVDDAGEQYNLIKDVNLYNFYDIKEKQINAWLRKKEGQRINISKKKKQVAIDSLVMEQLKSLGYIQYEGQKF